MVLYRMLTGQHPLRPKTDSFPGWYEAHNHQPPQPFDRRNLPYEIPAELEQVVLSCLAKDPGQRPQDMKLLSDQLEGSLLLASTGYVWPDPTKPIFSEHTLAAVDQGVRDAHLSNSRLQADGRGFPLWVGVALSAVIAGSTFWSLRLLWDPGDGLPRLPAAPEQLDMGEQDPWAPPELLQEQPLQDSQVQPVPEGDPTPEPETGAQPEPAASPQPQPTVTPIPVAPQPPPVAAPAPATAAPPARATSLPPQPLHQPLFPQQGHRAAPVPATPAQTPTPGFLRRLREERERLGND